MADKAKRCGRRLVDGGRGKSKKRRGVAMRWPAAAGDAGRTGRQRQRGAVAAGNDGSSDGAARSWRGERRDGVVGPIRCMTSTKLDDAMSVQMDFESRGDRWCVLCLEVSEEPARHGGAQLVAEEPNPTELGSSVRSIRRNAYVRISGGDSERARTAANADGGAHECSGERRLADERTIADAARSKERNADEVAATLRDSGDGMMVTMAKRCETAACGRRCGRSSSAWRNRDGRSSSSAVRRRTDRQWAVARLST
ncbi:hypothetical protein Scep_006570 [Stephania cephalantha]|uniref:Uncharacterized protein n=1 Tax=Stephania cephalantha TaxID=152367 RepID=A0AAP0K9Y1_9MAGN